MADVSENLEQKEIYFTKRITKYGSSTLLITIPADEKDFEHKDLVKVTLMRKYNKDIDDLNKKENNIKSNK